MPHYHRKRHKRQARARTKGVSPKLVLAVAGAVLGCLSTQTVLDLPGWADLLVLTGLVGLGAAVAPPGTVTLPRGDRGLTLLEALVALLLVAVALILIGALP
jgi:hypothetical protein